MILYFKTSLANTCTSQSIFSEQMGEAEVVGDLSVGGCSDPQEVMDGL